MFIEIEILIVGELFKCLISYTFILRHYVKNATFFLCFYLTKLILYKGVFYMPTTMPGREKVKKYLNENHIKIASLAKAYGLSRQVATDYISGRIQSPQSNKFILKVIEDLDL